MPGQSLVDRQSLANSDAAENKEQKQQRGPPPLPPSSEHAAPFSSPSPLFARCRDKRRFAPRNAAHREDSPLFASAASAAFSRIRLERKEGRERGERENLYILLFLLPFTPSCHAEGRKRKGERGAHGCSPVTLYTTPGPADRRRATPPPPGQTGRAPDVTQIRRRRRRRRRRPRGGRRESRLDPSPPPSVGLPPPLL